MKIVNICISAPYIEGFSYQENLLTDYFLDADIETTIIGSNILPTYMNSKRIKPGVYFDKGKKLTRLKCVKISTEFIIPFGLYKHLKEDKPNVIFHHNLNCTSLIICTLYRIVHPDVILLVDNHADYINWNKNKFWQLVYYKVLVRASAKFTSIFARKFYGVTHSRCDYLHEVYGVKQSKIDFLPIGTDLKTADSILDSKSELRRKYNIPDEVFVFVSGGKMGRDKGTGNLIKAINEMQSYQMNVQLLLFGSFDDSETEQLAKDSDFVIFQGWCDHETSLRFLKLANIAVWPIHHTTLIEDAISVETPLLIKKTRTTEHLIEGNGKFLDSSQYIELYSKMKICLDDYPNKSFEKACAIMKEKLSYESIVEHVIRDITG